MSPQGRALLLGIALALPGIARAQLAAGDQLDRAMQACLDAATGQTTQGMVGCTGAAIRGWDKRLNEVYQAALKRLDPSSADLLRTAQRRWVAFREAERAALGGPWRADRGSLIRIQAMDAELSALKQRVSELRLYSGDD